MLCAALVCAALAAAPLDSALVSVASLPGEPHIVSAAGLVDDRPVLTLNGTLTQWVEALKQIVAGASQDEQSKLFSRNAERIYRLA